MNLVAINTLFPLELCNQGKYRAAAEMAGLTVGEWPDRGSQGDSEHAEALLLAGAITSVEVGIQQLGDQSVARDMLLEAIRLFGDHPRTAVARSWLARAYYWDGELDRALELVGEVLDQPLDSVTRFRTLLTRASIYSDRELPEKAFIELREMEAIYETLAPLFKGQFHNQRGRVLRISGELDRAITEYDAAIHFFGLAENLRWQAAAANNLSEVYLQTEQFAQAHECATEARRMFSELGDKTFEAKALDQLARIYLAEGKLDAAEVAIDSAISLVEHGEILSECLETHRKINNRGVIKSTNDYANLSSASPTLPNSKPSERSIAMTPLDSAMRLIENNPDGPALLYDYTVWLLSARDDPQHGAEVDRILARIYSKTADCEKHQDDYRRSRLIREVPNADS